MDSKAERTQHYVTRVLEGQLWHSIKGKWSQFHRKANTISLNTTLRFYLIISSNFLYVSTSIFSSFLTSSARHVCFSV